MKIEKRNSGINIQTIPFGSILNTGANFYLKTSKGWVCLTSGKCTEWYEDYAFTHQEELFLPNSGAKLEITL